jgi:hypothetical protein
MSKKVDLLVTKYGITSLTNDNLQLFVSEIYNDGFSAGKETQQAFNAEIALRDHFAGLAMQGYLSGYYAGGDSHKAIAEESYELADAMLKARGELCVKKEKH